MKSTTIRRLAIPSAGIGASLCLAVSAFATPPPFTVTVGGSATGTHSYTATTTGATPQVDFHTDYVAMGCDSSTAAGNIFAGATATASAVKVGDITNTTWTNCVGPLGLDMVVAHNGTWDLMATDDTGSLTSGYIGNVDATVTAIDPVTGLPNPSLCEFHVTGQAAATLDTGAQSLAVNQDTANSAGLSDPLHIDSYTGCGGQVMIGDAAAIVTVFDANSPDGAIDVS